MLDGRENNVLLLKSKKVNLWELHFNEIHSTLFQRPINIK